MQIKIRKDDIVVFVTILSMLVVDVLLSSGLSIGYILADRFDLFVFVCICLLVLFLVLSYKLNASRMTRWIYRIILAILICKLLASVYFLIKTIIPSKDIEVSVSNCCSLQCCQNPLLHNESDPISLLRDAAFVWFSNIITFALLYWTLDSHSEILGYNASKHIEHFDFPDKPQANSEPNFCDYVFLAFTTSTALSPTDTNFISIRAKFLMMAQSLISMIVLVIIVSRTINMIN